AMETGRAIDSIEVGADELAVLHADAVVIDQIGHPTRRVDLVVGTADGARLGFKDGDAIGELFLQYEDASKPGIGRSIGDVELHWRALFNLARRGGRKLHARSTPGGSPRRAPPPGTPAPPPGGDAPPPMAGDRGRQEARPGA